MASFLDILNMNRGLGVLTIRQERIKREGSPYYSYAMPATAAAASVSFDVEHQFPDAMKYKPLTWLEIVNNEASNDLLLVLNGDFTFFVPAGSIRTIDNQAIWHIKITNNGGAITTLNKVMLTLQKPPLTIDEWARKQR